MRCPMGSDSMQLRAGRHERIDRSDDVVPAHRSGGGKIPHKKDAVSKGAVAACPAFAPEPTMLPGAGQCCISASGAGSCVCVQNFPSVLFISSTLSSIPHVEILHTSCGVLVRASILVVVLRWSAR
mmetsp:Transcript_19370/g.43284  ORF Transcript_19370/g.43284 Transcript_19370/m.43284 type:complete len:126 (-) Transcript_19370:4019-4396(-)